MWATLFVIGRVFKVFKDFKDLREYYSSTAACAAAKRAIGTRNGEQDA